MKDYKQVATTEMMVSLNNFTGSYAKAMLAATRQDDLARPDRPRVANASRPNRCSAWNLSERLNHDNRAIEATFGDDVLQLVRSTRYLGRLMQNANVARYPEVRHPCIAAEFQSIVGAATLATP